MKTLQKQFGSVWKMAVGCEGKYAVSRDGRVASLPRLYVKRARLLCQRNDRDGYPTVIMCLSVGQKTRKVHRLVAEAFIPNPDVKPTVNHKDSNRANPSVENLEWATAQENSLHGYRDGGRKPHPNQIAAASRQWRGTGNPRAKLRPSDVRTILQRHKKGDSTIVLANRFRVSRSTIQRLVYGKMWKHLL